MSVVICGGSGARLWPQSRAAMPKPFISLPGSKTTLIDDTYARLCAMPTAAVFTVAAAEHFHLCRDSCAVHGPQVEHFFIGEPLRRNTAAAIAVAAECVSRRFGGDAVLLVLPADHVIGNEVAFRHAVAAATAAANDGNLALLGVLPDYPATGYGYIEQGDALKEGVFGVHRFIEKPDALSAKKFLRAGNFLWNAGMFCFTPRTLAGELSQHAPDIAGLGKEIFTQDNCHGDGGNKFFPPAEVYERFPDISFDYAVMEKTDKAAVVVAVDIQWSDIGSWRALAARLPADTHGNRTHGDVLLKDCNDNLVIADKRLIACIGTQGLHVIDSPDALLVSTEKHTEHTRDIFDRLFVAGRAEAVQSTIGKRPWGEYTVLAEGGGYKVKRIMVAPGGCLSLQSHRRRSEHWTTVEGVMTVIIDKQKFNMSVGQACHVPCNARHRMANKTDKPATVIEVQTGDYLGEDDIIRYEDIYGRV
ncbi:MAG: mannose-1-phosphate guanylyltransferase/mannose-6-phosphate isomerase [Candidatus Zeuxoniibacter abyssi]|nr:MAG: mannose-1-phosphate guanylyltransferase/mannose-6-phosphate isomerase [Candidatus Persebacteraceae bacterium AB1(2)]